MSAATPPHGGRVLGSKRGVPYEIFLAIIDALIAEAEARVTPLKFSLTYTYESPTKIAVVPLPSTLDPSIGGGEIMRDRFSHIRLASQINRKTRDLVQRTFRRIPMYPHRFINAWVVREIDDFIPQYSGDILDESIGRRYNQAVLLPTPTGYAALQLIKRINLPVWEYFRPSNATGVAALLVLPNLRMISVGAGGIDAEEDFSNVHYGIRALDEKRFWTLANWMRDVPNLRRMWAPFKKKGVKLYAQVSFSSSMILELYPGNKRMGARYLRPNCDCDECKVIKQAAA